MAETTLTVKQLIDLGLWRQVCEYKGWNEWIVNEGMIDENELVTFDSEFKKEEEFKGKTLLFDKLTVGELEDILSKIQDKSKVVLVNDDIDVSDFATSIEEFETSILIK